MESTLYFVKHEKEKKEIHKTEEGKQIKNRLAASNIQWKPKKQKSDYSNFS